MQKLLDKLSHYTLQDALMIERSDRQFLALEYLYKNLKNKDIFLPLILANSTVGYLLSSSGELYWEEFSIYFSKQKIQDSTSIIEKMRAFLPLSKGNKRLNKHKNARLSKLELFLSIFSSNIHLYKEDFELFQKDLTKHMRQKSESKTITFSLKMHSYGVRIVKGADVTVPFGIDIPIDSRLTRIYDMYNEDKKLSIKEFYKQLSKKLAIPPIHLDGIIWTKYAEIISSKE